MSRHVRPSFRPRSRQQGGLILILSGLATLLALAAAGAAFWWFALANQAAAETAEASPSLANPYYVSLGDAFVVNLADDQAMRFLQTDVEVMTRHEEMVTALETHLPVIRNRLLLLLGSRRFEELATRADKEALQAAALDEVRKVLADAGETGAVEALYFTSMVMQ
ncbi:flagellar basal body-associated FliL family protein [Spectribacter hydrogenoxidans]|uniref:Flagellar protein FliL n=1 Tax=Spectribacter hydrogenoxidans TaxID=3075608 RepID=A0ABU3BVQ2_9GAMM|nr:flagellar basal body-associated FliL family protein [Salinisphaera sp. W335]MDT0633377.1 flagellar basal body-associated FliL family protein [Salinisphaera sp. W335]